jgi:hypothetical protein
MRDDRIIEIEPATVVGHVNVPFAKALRQEIPWGMA